MVDYRVEGVLRQADVFGKNPRLRRHRRESGGLRRTVSGEHKLRENAHVGHFRLLILHPVEDDVDVLLQAVVRVFVRDVVRTDRDVGALFVREDIKLLSFLVKNRKVLQRLFGGSVKTLGEVVVAPHEVVRDRKNRALFH